MLFRAIAVGVMAVAIAIAAPLDSTMSIINSSILLATLKSRITDNSTRSSRNSSSQWGVDKLRGVNIGGWLVLEPWITPSIFQNVDQSLGIVDEYTLCQQLPSQAPSILRKHWDTFATRNDFAKIALAGFNMVRIPIGFWAYDNADSAFVQGAADYLEAAIGWARASGLKIIIDLHGAPGSQNGYDNSGQVMANPVWMTDGGFWGGSSQRTLNIISTIAGKYAGDSHRDVVIGIELVNEPQGWRTSNDSLRQFNQEGLNRVRQFGNTTVVMSDAFLPPSTYNGFLTSADNTALDHHYYQVFIDYQLAMSPLQHRQAACNDSHLYTGSDKPTIIGEWTGAMTDCAPYLNGYGKGSRYDSSYQNSNYHGSCSGKNDIKQWSQQMKDDTRAFIEAQINTFEFEARGWVWWNFKTEMAHEWDAFVLLDAGVFPFPVWNRSAVDPCGGVVDGSAL